MFYVELAQNEVFDFVLNFLLFPFFFVDESNSNCNIKPIYSQKKPSVTSNILVRRFLDYPCLWDQT